MKTCLYVYVFRLVWMGAIFMTLSPLVNAQTDTVHFHVCMEAAAEHEFIVEMRLDLSERPAPHIDLRMPAWSPGYYQIMDFAKHVRSFRAHHPHQPDSLRWVQLDSDTWRVYHRDAAELLITYRVHTPRAFVGTAYLDTNRAFIKPAAVFMYVDQELHRPARLQIGT